MSRLMMGLALALLFAILLLVTVPARVLGLVLPPQQIVMQGYAGTLWNGSASRCMIRLPAGYLHLGAVRWSLEPLSLLTLAPRVTVRSDWGTQFLAGTLVLRGRDALDLYEAEGSVSADLLRQFAPVSVSGHFSMQLQSLQLREGLPMSTQGRLVWQNAGWMSPGGNMPLGSYALDIEQPEGEALVGNIVTLNGPLEAAGDVRLDGRRYELNILASGDAVLEGQLKEGLSLLAVPGPDGYRIELDGSF